MLESAQNKGVKSLSLSYNLGVVYYKLAEYGRSRQAFAQLVGTKQSSLAHYNLGLIALAEGDSATARNHFKVVAANSDQPKLTKLAHAQLQKLGSTPPAPKQWQAFLSLAAGYEDNLGLFPDTAASTLEDGFLESIGAASGYAYQDGKNAIKWKAQFYIRDYFEEDDFNTHLLRLGTAWNHDAGRNRMSLGLEGDQLWLADSSREQRARLVAAWITPSCSTRSLSARCQIKLEAEQIFADKPQFEAYEGQHYRLDTRYRARYGDWSGELQYRFDFNDRKDRDIGDEFFSVSPMRHTLGFKLSYAITRAFTVGTDASFRQSDYTHAHRFNSGETITRSDQRLTYHLNAQYQFDHTFAVTTKLGRLSNESNIDRYQYDRETVTLGVNVRL
ncbi:MAG: heme biosynthesis protein HemY [Gammaproteobacteria bacterium]|uniref:heme biosynthesis HemY N-terminal domain-containing protein n=1 Tax=Marinobacter litoralis TaxID=187981 RepID=UPI00105878A8|nr:heme biosynthesis HemY N-terminal domain-containing protein [Marinobacter litoralis]MBR9871145.1 heme biosynthesis protein HemY [Gammaproteobacteria bacterium]